MGNERFQISWKCLIIEGHWAKFGTQGYWQAIYGVPRTFKSSFYIFFRFFFSFFSNKNLYFLITTNVFLFSFLVNLGSFGALDSKRPVSRKQLALEWKPKRLQFVTRELVEHICIWRTFDLVVFRVISGLLGTPVSKWTVFLKWPAVEQIGLKFGTWLLLLTLILYRFMRLGAFNALVSNLVWWNNCVIFKLWF